MLEKLATVLSCVALATAILSSTVALHSIYRQIQGGKPRDRFYDDSDGSATPETVSEFSNKSIKITILILCILGTTCSTVLVITSALYGLGHNETVIHSLYAAAWVS